VIVDKPEPGYQNTFDDRRGTNYYSGVVYLGVGGKSLGLLDRILFPILKYR